MFPDGYFARGYFTPRFFTRVIPPTPGPAAGRRSGGSGGGLEWPWVRHERQLDNEDEEFLLMWILSEE